MPPWWLAASSVSPLRRKQQLTFRKHRLARQTFAISRHHTSPGHREGSTVEVEGLVVIYRFVLRVFVCACVCVRSRWGVFTSTMISTNTVLFSAFVQVSPASVCAAYTVCSVWTPSSIVEVRCRQEFDKIQLRLINTGHNKCFLEPSHVKLLFDTSILAFPLLVFWKWTSWARCGYESAATFSAEKWHQRGVSYICL